MTRSDIKRDQKSLDNIIKKYGKEDILKYLNENFENSFDTNETDYVGIMNNNENIRRKQTIISAVNSGKAVPMAISLKNHNTIDPDEGASYCAEPDEVNNCFVRDMNNDILYSFHVIAS